jgi:hypothetical protein
MPTIEERISALEAKHQSRQVIATPEFLEDCRMVAEYFESNGSKIDTKPRDDMTEIQCAILAVFIDFELKY